MSEQQGNPKDNSNENLIDVIIMNKTYTIRLGEQKKEYIQNITDVVNKKIEELKTAFPELPENKLLVLTCLNFADQITNIKNQKDFPQKNDYKEEIEQKLNRLLELF